MNTQDLIEGYIATQPEQKRTDMEELHKRILQIWPGCKQWFDDGKNAENKTVSNPSIGYGTHTIKYANGTSKEVFKIGLSANTSGLSVYILGIDDKSFLAQTYGKQIGKATVTGYCIKFKNLKDINIDVLEAAIQYGANHAGENLISN